MSKQYQPPPQQYQPPPQQYQPPPQQYYSQQPQYYPPPTASYNQPPTYEYNYGREEGHGYGQAHNTVAEKWNKRPKFQDLWAIILFIIHLIGFAVLSYVGIIQLIQNMKNNKNNPPSNTNSDSNNPNNSDNIINDVSDIPSSVILLLVTVGIFGFVLSLLYMLLMQRFPKPLIRITLYLSIAFYFVAAAVFAYLKQYLSAIFLVIFGIIYLICAFTWRDRIPFAAILLETVTALTKKYYGTIIIGLVGLVLQVGWSILWIVTLVGAIDKFYQSSGCGAAGGSSGSSFSCNQPTLYLVVVYLVFSFYWTSQVIKTIIHVTDSGVFATFYFLEGTSQGTGPVPTLSSLKRACTTSIGSVCYGSLIIAILNTTRFILRSIARSDNNACGAFLAACLECLLSWIEQLVEYFNFYAYVQVAIYGKSYCEAAKETWNLIKARGVDAIINDNLVGNVLVMGGIFIGALCALFGFGYIHLFLKNIADDSTEAFILVLICFFFGLVMTGVVTNVIESGVSTTFVALAESPDALRRTKPQLFERIRREWPQIVQGI